MSINKILAAKSKGTVDPIGDLVTEVSRITASEANTQEKIGKLALSTESLSEQDVQHLDYVYGNIEAKVKEIGKQLGHSFEEYQVEAATIGALLGTNPQAFLKSVPHNNASGATVIMGNFSDSYASRQGISAEAYDERNNRNAQLQSIVYNLLSARQDDFGELFFPTIIVNPNEVGLSISAKLFYAYNDFKRTTTGALAEYGRRNLVRAYADNTILENELTRAVPIWRENGDPNSNEDIFVVGAPQFPVTLRNNYTVTSGYLAVDKKIDFIGVSQTDELIGSGIMGPTDSLDTSIQLMKVLVKNADDELIEFDVSHLVGSHFNFAPQGNYRTMLLNMETSALVVTEDLVDIVTDAAATAPAGLTGNVARVELTISGRVSIDKGDMIINRGALALHSLRREDGELIVSGGVGAPTDFDTLEAALEDWEVVGYVVKAYRANSNLRQRGQLIDNQTEYRLVTVPHRAPIASLAPATESATDNSALQTIINATGIKVSNDAVTALIDAYNKLSAYQWDMAESDVYGEMPELDIIGQFYVKPYFKSETLTMNEIMDSIKSHERIKDIRAAIVEKIRWYANDMYLKTEYKAAANVLTGNRGFKPTVIVGTDPVIANYLTFDGDLRALGDTFDIRIVSSLDRRLINKIYMSFGVFDGDRNSKVNPLNFGNMLYSPEVTVQMPISRDGQVSNELIVSPRYTHYVSLPALVCLDVKELGTLMERQEYWVGEKPTP